MVFGLPRDPQNPQPASRKSGKKPLPRRKAPSHQRRRRLFLESLEDRRVMTADDPFAPWRALASITLPEAPQSLDPNQIYDITPLIVAGDPSGAPPDSPATRIDPNVAGLAFSGVASIRTTIGM